VRTVGADAADADDAGRAINPATDSASTSAAPRTFDRIGLDVLVVVMSGLLVRRG
jgi:hypothetical protein